VYGSIGLDDAADLIGGFSGEISCIEVFVAPGDLVYVAKNEEAVDAAQGFGEGAGPVDFVAVFPDANQLARLDGMPTRDDWDHEDFRVWRHSFILG